MKKCIVTMLAVAITTLFSGCVTVNFGAGGNMVLGKGDLKSTEYNVGAYTAVDIRTGMELIYSEEVSDKVVIEIQENLIEYLDVRVENGVLIVDTKNPINTGSKDPKIYISNPDLSKISVSGFIIMSDCDKISGESFVLEVFGAAEIEAEFDVDELHINGSGAVNMDLSGRADTADINISGAGAIEAMELQTKSAFVAISGTGDVEISCSDNLDVDISGAGSVVYRGDPKVTQNTGGIATIKKEK